MIIYIHGMGQHRPIEKNDWDRALFGELVAFSHMACYSDLLPSCPVDVEFNREMNRRLMAKASCMQGQYMVGDTQQAWLLKQVTRRLIDDVHAYLFTKAREKILERVKFLLDLFRAQPDGELIVIGHSLGSIVAYEALLESGAHVDLFLTIGSPLGIEPVKARLRQLHGDRLTMPQGVKNWLNYADRYDVVAFDTTLRNDYLVKGITDIEVVNNHRYARDRFGPHSGIGYLSLDVVREAVKGHVKNKENNL